MTAEVDPLTLRLLVPPEMQAQASNVILSREMGPWRRLSILAVPALGAVILAIAAGWLVGVSSLNAGLMGLYGYFGAVAGFFLIRKLLGQRNLRLLSGSALRSTPVLVQLVDTGLVFAERSVPWSGVTAVGRWKDTTLLYFSPVDALVVPDRDLPAGLSAEALGALVQARIAQ
jgi:hypothetical protein